MTILIDPLLKINDLPISFVSNTISYRYDENHNHISYLTFKIYPTAENIKFFKELYKDNRSHEITLSDTNFYEKGENMRMSSIFDINLGNDQTIGSHQTIELFFESS